MHKAKLNYIRLVFAVTGLAIVILLVVALFQRQAGIDLVGSWQLAALDGVPAPKNATATNDGFEILADGSFDFPSYEITGTWKIDGTNLVLRTEKYDGKTQAQFRAETQAKYPSDPAMQKISNKVFEPLNLAIGADGSALSINLGGIVQKYTKKPSK